MTASHGVTTLARTGIEGLDDILGGGLIRNRLHLIEGEPGSGKTTLALQFLLEGARLGEGGVYVTLSETEEELRDVASSHGWSLDPLSICEATPSQDNLLADNAGRMFHPSEVELSETTRAILLQVEKTNPRRIVFDSLSEMRLLAQSPLRYRRQILALKKFFTGRQCTVLLLDDQIPKKSDQQLHSLAHGVIRLEHSALEFGAERRRIRVVKVRGVQFRGGYHDFVIRRGGLQIYPRLVAAEHHREFDGTQLTSGVNALDRLLGGGLDRGSSTLLIGPAGTGKSSITAQYIGEALRRGENAAAFLFDESIHTFLTRASGMGQDFSEAVASGRLTLRQVDPAELSPGEFAHTVRQAVEQQGARVVVIDSLNGYLQAMPEERFLVIQLHEILTYLGQLGVVTVMVVAQHGLVGAGIHAPVDATYLADIVILVRFFEARGRLRRAISVVKRRAGPHEDTVREMRLTSEGVWVGEPLEKYRGVLTGVPVPAGEDTLSES